MLTPEELAAEQQAATDKAATDKAAADKAATDKAAADKAAADKSRAKAKPVAKQVKQVKAAWRIDLPGHVIAPGAVFPDPEDEESKRLLAIGALVPFVPAEPETGAE